MEAQSSSPDTVAAKDAPPFDPVGQRIVAEARRHFFSYGFRAVTMDDLAKGLGMSKKTLYSHFPSKAALVAAVLMDKSREVGEDLERITSDSSSDFFARLHQLLAKMREHLDEIQPPFLRDMQREGPDLFRAVEARRRDLIHHYFGKLVEEGRNSGIIRNDIPTRLIVEILFAAVHGIMNPVQMMELELTPSTGFSAIISVIFEGVITEKGRANL